MEDAERQLSDVETKYKCDTLKLKSHNHDLLMGLEAAGRDKPSLFSTPCKAALTSQLPSLNGDFLSEAGSLVRHICIEWLIDALRLSVNDIV